MGYSSLADFLAAVDLSADWADVHSRFEAEYTGDPGRSGGFGIILVRTEGTRVPYDRFGLPVFQVMTGAEDDLYNAWKRHGMNAGGPLQPAQ